MATDLNLRLADMHCDTAEVLYNEGAELKSSKLHISLDKTAKYSQYVQLAAVWSDEALTNEECFENFFKIKKYFSSEISKNADSAALCETFDDISAALASGKAAFVLSVEGLRLIGNELSRIELSRIELLRREGVRVATLTWGGLDVIGGSHDTDAPLTELGRSALDECFRVGIVPDISHLSHAGAKDVFEVAKRHGLPVLATHSNSDVVCSCSRNLADEEFKTVVSLGGLVGISMCPYHLTLGSATASDAADHVCHYLKLCGGEGVALGCDFDGIGHTPSDISDVSELGVLANELSKRGVSDDLIDRVFFGNLYSFLKSNLR